MPKKHPVKAKQRSPAPVTPPPATEWPVRPYLICAVALFAFIFPLFNPYALDRPAVGLDTAMAWGVLSLFLFTSYGVVTNKLARPRSWFFCPVAAYTAVSLLAGTQSPSWYRAFAGGLGPNADGLGFYLFMVTLGWCVITIIPTIQEARAILATLHVQAFFLALNVIWQFGHYANQTYPYRPLSIFNNPDFYISYVMMFIPGAAWFAWKSRAQKTGNRIWNLRYPVLIVVLGLSLFLTIPNNLQTILIPQKVGTAIVKELGIFNPAPTTSSAGQTPAVTNTKEFLEDSANVERFTLWRIGIKSGLAHPLIGSGPGSTNAEFFKYINQLPNWDYATAPTSFHDDLIDRFAHSGFIGLITYIIFWASIFAAFFRRRKYLEPEARQLAAVFLAGLTGLFIFDLFAFRVANTFMLMWIFIGLLLTLTGTVQQNITPIRRPAMALIMIWAVVLGTGTFWITRMLQAEQLATNGQAATVTQNDVGSAMNDYTQAASIVPWEGLFPRQEAANGLYVVIALKQDGADPSRIATATSQTLAAAATAAKLQPYDPLTIINTGVIDYVLGTPGSPTEATGVTLMTQAKAMTYYNPTIYKAIGQAFTLKGVTVMTQAEDDLLYKGAPQKVVTETLPTVLTADHLVRP